MWDVLAYCEREGSLDSKIKNETPNDFKLFYSKNPNIKHVVFSSKAAEMYYRKYEFHNPAVIYHILPSPSGANANKTFLQKLEMWQKLADI